MTGRVKDILNSMQVGLMMCLCRTVSAMPYWVQYHVIQEILYFVFRYVVRYRRRLIMRQLSDSFPEWDEARVRRTCDEYYQTLAEAVVNTITLAGMDNVERASRVTFCGQSDINKDIEGRNVVVLTSHYGFWEYYSFASLWLCRNHKLMVAYHQLKSRAWEDFYMRLRRTDLVYPVSSKQFMRFYMNHRDGIDGKHLVIGLVSDQNSPPRGECHWYRFLNHDSLFFDGGEHLARRFGLPVYYLELDRIKRGYYRCSYRMIYDGSEQVGPHEITERYVRSLERTIVRRPELWLWSHNRWKFRRAPVADTKES